MAPTSGKGAPVAIYMVGMLITGTLNTLILKYQDKLYSKGLDKSSPDMQPDGTHLYNHPAVQVFFMFVGEAACMAAFWWTSRKRYAATSSSQPLLGAVDASDSAPKPFPKWLFLLPTLCDAAGSALSFVAMNLTYASVYQMFRGAVVPITGIFSIVFLGHRLLPRHWLGMFLIVAGISLVGLSSVLYSSTVAPASNPVLGMILLLVAQVFSATLFILEEKFLGQYHVPPLQAVGLEGLWGVLVSTIVLIALYFVPGENAGSAENSIDALVQIGNSMPLLGTVIGGIFAIAFFNFCGITVTQNASATARSTIDTSRTLFIWIACVSLGWEDFHWLQVGGFVLLVAGTMIYNKIVTVPLAYFEEDKTPSAETAPDAHSHADKLSGMGANSADYDSFLDPRHPSSVVSAVNFSSSETVSGNYHLVPTAASNNFATPSAK